MRKMGKIKIVAIVGPTASGKTGLAVELAKRFNGEVVSADSMQIYSELSIGTARPSEEEKQGICHHLIGFLDVNEDYSVADYVNDAREAVRDIVSRGKLPILCGGTGLYVDSFLQNTQFEEIESDPIVHEKLLHLAENEGKEKFFERLKAVDPKSAERLHFNNLGRVLRALEVYELTGKTMTELQEQSHREPSPYDVCYIGTTFEDREKLYTRIERRIDSMLDKGILDEARFLLEHDNTSTATQAIGYKEFFPYFQGKSTLEDAVNMLKKETRHYAKRQLTWFRRNEKIHWLFCDHYETQEMLYDEAATIVEHWRYYEEQNA